ncbi:hypothetical protein [Tunturiibacter lichenicola]|uniref:hypothetical protein n=1 Tax=Tunturiibacter lichenicola TaxID=2051959 RepID=UPI0021B23792|nr:hypothetical protein [Edaphobacter lichenicola]
MHRIHFLAANIALFAAFSVAGAQQTTPAGPVYPDTNVPDKAAPPTKDQLKAQKAQQKKEEKSADANAKAAKADAKAKKQHDKAVQAGEKANPSAPAASTPPSATPVPQN